MKGEGKMLDPEVFMRMAGIRPVNKIEGEQELILFEILTLMKGFKTYIPLGSRILSVYMKLNGLGGSEGQYPIEGKTVLPSGHDALYFGTPTIVDDRPLWAHDRLRFGWTKHRERIYVREICKLAERASYKRIISGLGSGDISPEERISDMGGGKIVCFKDFGLFQDWVIVRDL